MLLQEMMSQLLSLVQTDIDFDILVKEDMRVIVSRYVNSFLDQNQETQSEQIKKCAKQFDDDMKAYV